jgi:hypothetical protein
MPIAKIEPTDKHPVPYSLDADEPEDYLTQILIAANTADVLEELGAPLEVDDATFHKEKALIDAALKGKNPDALRQYPAAIAASAFVKRYGSSIAHEVSEVRTALTNKLLEIADCGDTKHELRAIELLGKHVDIGLFTERSEINVNYKDPESLEKAIKERVKRLLNADIIDVTPVGLDLDEELGIFGGADDAESAPEGDEPDA